MNNLVKLLVEDLLNGDGKTVAIFGGGFKPPTAGHLEVVKNTLSQFPEINELIVFVGGGVRDGITQAESLDIWNIYKKHLPNNVKIETTVAPVKAVLDYAKNNPEDKVYWILGTREGNEEDVKDIIERTKSVGKYPNIEVKIINTDNSTSGTKARQALKANNKEEFLKYIPNIPEQEQIWNVVSPVIKEIVTDTEIVCDKCGWHWPIVTGGKDLYVCHQCGHNNNPALNESYQFKVSDKVYDNEDKSLITVEYTFSTPDNTYRVEFYSGEYSPESKIFDVSFGIDKYGSKLDTFQMTGEGNALNILKTIIDIIIDFTNRFEVNKLIINPTSEKREKIYSMILKSLPSDISSKVELIKENNEKTWDLKEGIVSLTKYMVDNGLNIKPLPKVKFIRNDKENASNLLGRTAYYNPADKSITLYTFGRHPKDVLRSFSHEMIHHMQNLEGKLDNINTTNTNEGGDLPEMEREAYEKGNMMLRNWEDSIKSEKYLKEYKQYVLTELFEKDLPNIKKISKNSYLVGNGDDIEAEYVFELEIPEKNIWSLSWFFTPNNKNTSSEAWKQVTATTFKVLENWLETNNPKSLHISGNTQSKTNLYKNYVNKLQTLLNNRYKIDNSDEDKVVLRSIEETNQSGIKKRIETLNESYEQALNYWQNGDINSKSKIERWNSIKKKIEREVLQEVYNIKNV